MCIAKKFSIDVTNPLVPTPLIPKEAKALRKSLKYTEELIFPSNLLKLSIADKSSLLKSSVQKVSGTNLPA